MNRCLTLLRLVSSGSRYPAHCNPLTNPGRSSGFSFTLGGTEEAEEQEEEIPTRATGRGVVENASTAKGERIVLSLSSRSIVGDGSKRNKGENGSRIEASRATARLRLRGPKTRTPSPKTTSIMSLVPHVQRRESRLYFFSKRLVRPCTRGDVFAPRPTCTNRGRGRRRARSLPQSCQSVAPSCLALGASSYRS